MLIMSNNKSNIKNHLSLCKAYAQVLFVVKNFTFKCDQFSRGGGGRLLGHFVVGTTQNYHVYFDVAPKPVITDLVVSLRLL